IGSSSYLHLKMYTGKMHDVPNTDDRLLSTVTWQTTMAIALLAALSLSLAGLGCSIEVSADTLVLMSCYAFCAIYFSFVRPNPKIARGLICFGQLVVVILMGVMLSYAASTVPLPYRDADLHAMDQWLGFDRAGYLAVVKKHEGLRNALSLAYNSMMSQNILVLAAAILTRRLDRLQFYIIAFAVAVTATAAIACFIPAANAIIYVDRVATELSTLPDGGHSYFPVLEGLRNGTLRVIDFRSVEGLISFPSFHTANAILFVWALWPIRILRFVLVPLNLLLIAGTPLCGAHYGVDVIGGAAVACGAIAATTRLVRARGPSSDLVQAIPSPIDGKPWLGPIWFSPD
ncbi:phosphatase PAP2 family protein, partial [Bradyrhizobium guangdongense]|uniref:phosphatase PAP2 family protein n=1 Tax=Bradyrhizobium guangdongense TaxID=1325090 RepID=UPI001AEC82A2